MSLVGAAHRQLRRLPEPVKGFLRGARHPGHALRQRRKRAEIMVFLQTVASYCDGIRGKRILEVGSDSDGMLIREAARRFEPRELDHALAEMYRIMKPGGYVFSHFGPIWSTSYGHHLWLTVDGRLYDYWNAPLPPYCHLLMSGSALTEHCRERYDERVSARIVEYVYHSPDQNQLFYEDYERVVTASAFETCIFKGYDHAELAVRYRSSSFPEVLDELKRRFPGRRNFSYDGITLLLRKPW